MKTETVKGNIVTVGEVIKDAADRAKTKTPPFFERIQRWAKMLAWVAAGIGTTGLAITSNIATGGVAVPLWITITLGVLSGFGTGAGIGAAKIASITTANKEILSRPSNAKLKI